MTYINFKLDTDADGIVLITWDAPSRSMNVIDLNVIDELSDIVETVAGDRAIRGAVITSGKEAFCAGADLTMLEASMQTFAERVTAGGEEAAATALFENSRKLSLLYRRLETCGKPWVAAITGTALGGGFELCLACHHRVAGESANTRVGLPEIKIGLFPGAGGTQRIARMMPPADALRFLLKGEHLRLAQAKDMKLIDAIVLAADVVPHAKDWIRTSGVAKAPWDVEGFRLPGGPVYSKAGMMTFPAATAIYRRETYDNYPSARAVMQVVYEGLQLPMDVALRVESRWFAKILRSPEAAAMIRTLFVSTRELNKGARRPKTVPTTSLKTIGVVGAGFMGAGIAYVTATAGLNVVLIDRDQEAADKGKAHSEKLVAEQIDKGRATTAERDALLARIAATLGLRRAQGLQPRRRGSVRGPQDQGRRYRRGGSRDRGGGSLRLQHFDPADHLARGDVETARKFHRHPFLFASRAHDAGGGHPRQTNERNGTRGRARLRACDSQDADRCQRRAWLLHLACCRHLHPRGPSDARRRRASGDDRKSWTHGGNASGAALPQR